MIISYWDCKFSDYDERWDEVEQEYIEYYRCSNPKNELLSCEISNKGFVMAECKIAELKQCQIKNVNA